MENYKLSAITFLEKTKVSFEARFIGNKKHFEGDEEVRDVYLITLKRGERVYKFEFGQSLAKSTKYVDKVNGNEFTPSGTPLKGNIRIVLNIEKNLNDWCEKVEGTPPDEYGVLATLTKYDVGTLENFCSEYGYSTDSKTAEKIYLAVKDEYLNVCRLWSEDELEVLREIQ